MTKPKNAFSVDVEDAFQVSAFRHVIRPEDWDGLERRVDANTRRLLDLLDESGTRGTFFVLGWVAEREPALVREIARRGHEIASHGTMHQLIYEQSPETFRDDVRRARRTLQDITGQPVWGYRAPSCSVVAGTLWALDVLLEEGYRYDSSVFPVHHPRYGIPDAPRFPSRIPTPSGATIAEFPLTTARLGRWNLAVAGGGWLRLLPLAVLRAGLRSVAREGQPAVLYVHPWEIDPGQERRPVGAAARFTHYVGLATTEPKVRALLARGGWGTLLDVLEDRLGSLATDGPAASETAAPSRERAS